MSDRFDEQQERWLAGALDSSQLDEFERDLLHDPQLAEAAYEALELKDALGEAARQPRRLRPAGPLAWAGGLMAAVLALVILMPQFMGPGEDLPLLLRGAGDTGAAVGVAPSGELDRFPLTFRWHPANAEKGSRFRWELYDSQARRRHIAIVADSVLVRKPSQTPADSLGSWLWLVVELKSDGHEGPTSAAMKFSVKEKASQ